MQARIKLDLFNPNDQQSFGFLLFKGASSRFEHPEKFRLNFSSSSFAIRVNLLHP